MASKELQAGRPLNLVVVGRTGRGKSETANTILGKHLFISSDGDTSCTKICQKECEVVAGRKITLVDTPGCMHTEKGTNILHEIAEVLVSCPDGYDGFLIVLQYGVGMTREEMQSILELEKVFGSKMYRHSLVIFTHGDDYATKQDARQAKGQTPLPFSEYISTIVDSDYTHPLHSLLQKVDNRVILFNNYAVSRKKRETVIEMVTMVDRKMHGRYDSNLFEKTRKILSEKKMTRKEAIKKVFEFLLTLFKVVAGVLKLVAI